jgi:cell division protein FtsB
MDGFIRMSKSFNADAALAAMSDRYQEAQSLNEQLSAENIKLSEEISALSTKLNALVSSLLELMEDDCTLFIASSTQSLALGAKAWLEERGKE